VIATHTIQINNQAEDDERAASLQTLIQSGPLHALVCAPLTIQDKDLGALLIWSERERSFNEHDSRIIALFADQAALALGSAHLHILNRQLAIEQERQRLARELHDSVAQTLYSISMAAETSLKLIDQKSKRDIRLPISHIHQLARVAIKELREQVHNLHPTTLAVKSLAELLEAHCQMLREQHHLAIELTAAPNLGLSIYQRENLYHIAKEALWNAVKYAGASRVKLKLTREQDQISLLIADEGPGFVESTVSEPEMFGLRSMKERVSLLGGIIEIDSEPGLGTIIKVRIPVQA
jgi:signal transduction histidine kinase